MMVRFNSYLESIRRHLKFDPAAKRQVLRELKAHVEDRIEELRCQGFSEEAATERVIGSLGSPRLVGQQLAEVYSQGSWKQAVFAALPHMLVAWLLAMSSRQGEMWITVLVLVATVTLTAGVVIYGWKLGKPTWLFPWLGYCMIPVILAGVLIVSMPAMWNWAVALTYMPLALVALFYIVRQTLREDWLLATLMMLPLPVVLAWGIVIGVNSDPDWLGWRLFQTAPRISLSFLALAVTSATFVRIKQRRVKIAALITPEVGFLLLLGLTSETPLSSLGWALFAAGSMVLLLSPAWLENRLR